MLFGISCCGTSGLFGIAGTFPDPASRLAVLQGPAYTEVVLKASTAPRIISLLVVIAGLLRWLSND